MESPDTAILESVRVNLFSGTKRKQTNLAQKVHSKKLREEMDGLIQVLVLSLLTALSRGEGCSMVQDFDADLIFNQSSQLPPPLRQLNVKNSKICNSKCCASDGCNVAYFDSDETSKYSCMLYSCHPLPTCGFLSQEGVQVSVNEVDLLAYSLDIVTPSVTTGFEQESGTDPVLTTQTVNYQTSLSQINTQEAINASQSSIEISTTTVISNDTAIESHEADNNTATNYTAASNDKTSESYETNTKSITSNLQSSTEITYLNTTISNVETSKLSETETNSTGTNNNIVSQTPLQIMSTPIGLENDTPASHNDSNGVDSTFRPSLLPSLTDQIIPTQTLDSSVVESSNHSTSMTNSENNLHTTNDKNIQPSMTIYPSASEKISFPLSSSFDASSAQTSQNVAFLQSSPVSALPSTILPNSNGTDSNSAPILATSTVIIDSPKELITSYNGSSDQIQSTGTTYPITSDHQADDSISATSSSSLLNFDVSKYTGNVWTPEVPVNIAPTRSENVVTSWSFVIEAPANNGTDASASTSVMPNVLKTLLLCSLAFGCIFILAVVGVLGKLVFDSYRKRHYSRLDYLINGMY